MSIKTSLTKLFGVEKIVKRASPVQVLYPAPVPQKFAIVGGFPVYSPINSLRNINEYCTSEDVYAIVSRIAKTAAMVPLKNYVIKNQKAFDEYLNFIQQKTYNTQNLLKGQFLKTKALEYAGDNNDLQRLLDNPNPQYSKVEYLEGSYTFRLLTGNNYEHAPLLEFGVNAGRPNELWLMPPQWTSIQVSDTWPRMITAYKLQIAGLITLSVEEVIHTRKFNPRFTYVGNELIGMSPLEAGAKTLDRGEAETDYSVNAFQNSGISGIVGNETLRMDEIEQGALGKMKTDFYNESAGVNNARKLLFMAGKINYTNIGLSPVDMDVLASEIRTFKKLCNLYGVSDMLFNNDGIGNGIGGKTDIVFKDLYTNAAFPEVDAKRDAYNSFLVPKFNTAKEKYFIDKDITAITELQDDMKDMASVLSTSPVMNPRFVAEAFGWDTTNIQDAWFVKQGYQTIEDAMMGAVQPLPVDTINGN